MKAALVLGLINRSLDVTEADRFGLRGEVLDAALKEDLAAGRHPFILSTSSWRSECIELGCITSQNSRYCGHDFVWSG